MDGMASRVDEATGRRAGFVSRFLADAVDLLAVVVLTAIVHLGTVAIRFLLSPRRFSWESPSALGLGGLFWAILVVYLTLGWSGAGRTPGKQVLGLRVERMDGRRLGVPLAFVRAVICGVFPLGLFWSLVSRTSASVADLLLRTKVVYDWRARVPTA